MINVVKVIPISKGIAKEELTYFTSANISAGSIVSIPLRGKRGNALVLSSEKLSDVKSQIRSSDFKIKKIEKIKALNFFSREFIESARQVARHSTGSTGATLNALIPKSILEKPPKVSIGLIDSSKKNNLGLSGYIIQAEDIERLADYKSIVREEFARGHSVVFILPTLKDLERVSSSVEKGIKDYTFVFHGGLKEKEISTSWKKVLEEKHPVLIVATPMFLGIPRGDIGTIILEKESSRAWESKIRPFIDYRIFAEIFAREIGARLIFGDLMLRTETIWRYRNHELVDFVPPKFRLLSSAKGEIVDMRQYKKKKGLVVLSDEVVEIISSARESGGRTFIFNVRKGLFPLTVCGDCQSLVKCHHCSALLVLHRSGRTNVFVCHTCGEKRKPDDKCDNCGSWKLETLGIGTELVAESIEKIFPDIKLFRLDGDTAKTHKKALEIVKKFNETAGGVLLGTEMALSYLDQEVENCVVVSLDSLFSVPDFRINEKVFSILVKIRSLCRNNFLVQTRNPEQKPVIYALAGNAMDFYREEIKSRDEFGYPPFSVLIKITLSGDRSNVTEEMKNLNQYFEGFEFQAFPAFTSVVKGRYIMHGLIKLSPEKWVHEELLERLRALPMKFIIKVNPDSLL